MNDTTMRTERDRVDAAALRRFLDLLRAEYLSMLVATAFFAAVGIWQDKGGMLAICLFGLVSGTIRQYARVPARRGDMRTALLIFAVCMWATSVFVVLILPLALPVMIFNVINPVLIGSTYLDDRDHRPLVLGGVIMAAVLALAGFAQPGLGMEEGVDEIVVVGTSVGFLAGYTYLFSTAVRDANRTRVATLDAALDANEELLAARADVMASRRRVVVAADAERSRIERDLHDGAQQRLVSLALQLRLAGQLADAGAPPDRAQLDELREQADDALAELRDLARGIHPPMLAERGLVAALRSVARLADRPVRVDGPSAIELDPDLASAAYFVALEALQNATKHAGEDAAIEIAVELDEATLRVRVADDGPGFDRATVEANGLVNMADRTVAMGGTFDLRARPGTGTSIVATFPLGAPGGMSPV